MMNKNAGTGSCQHTPGNDTGRTDLYRVPTALAYAKSPPQNVAMLFR